MTANPPTSNGRSLYFGGCLGFAILSIALLGVVGWMMGYLDGRLSVKNAGNDVLKLQVEAWNRGDLNGFVATYRMSDDVTFFGGGSPTKGWAEILERYQKTFGSPGARMGQLQFENVQVEALAYDSALVRGRWVVSDNGQSKGGLFTIVLRKGSDGWKIIHDHTSSDAP